MDFRLEVEINKNIEDVWEVMGNQFGDIAKWVSLATSSKVGGSSKLPGVNYGYRLLESRKGTAKHVLTSFDSANHSFSYDVPEGTPGFVKTATASWTLTALKDGKTKMNVHFGIQLSGLFGFFLAPVAKKKLGTVSNNIIEEFKYYVENGKPHPRKLAA
jgi:hypothetical protein